MAQSTIKVEDINEVRIIKFDRPDVLNSINAALSASLVSALNAAASDDSVRVIVLTGEGKAFCAGQDLAEVKDNFELGPVVINNYNPVVKLIRSIEKPIICGLNGVAAGAGANIALACDIIVAVEKASLIQAFSQVGLIPDSGGTFFLPRLVGLHRATALTFFGDKLTAQEAQSLGLIYKVLPDHEYPQGLMEVATKLSKAATRALGLTKRGFNRSLDNSLDEQLALEAELQHEAGKTSDYREGLNAFLEKRRASYQGK